MSLSISQSARRSGESVEHVELLIIGAGLSGIAAACHFHKSFPDKSYAILEARDSVGGTWDLFRYPGLRSDSDLYTFAYAFKPWTDPHAIAGGDTILDYIRETASEHDVDGRIRFGRRVTRAEWSSEQGLWQVESEQAFSSAAAPITCRWLFSAAGYFRYDRGYEPDFPGIDRFKGAVVDPQAWPEDLDYADKRVVVIGSGATAVTLIPAIAASAEHVTMLQRSPTYVVSVPSIDPLAKLLKRFVSEQRASSLTRRKNVWLQQTTYRACQSRPRLVKRLILWSLKRQLPEGYDVATHFSPSYDPWDQRLCAVPDGDLFKVLSNGTASVVTDQIASFTEDGIELASGEHLDAEIIVTATGLEMMAFGGIDLIVDGQPVSLPQTIAYRGAMLSDVPNFAFAVGYSNLSWTLKVDLVCDYFCRLVAYMDRCGYDRCVPANYDPAMETLPLLKLSAGYVQRALGQFPRQGTQAPWALCSDYAQDQVDFSADVTADGALEFSSSRERAAVAVTAA